MTRPLILIEDARDDDDASARASDPLRRPRRVDELQRQRASEPPFGQGLYERTCLNEDCGFRFRTEDPYAVLCPACDAEEAAQFNAQGKQDHYYSSYRRAGGRRE